MCSMQAALKGWLEPPTTFKIYLWVVNTQCCVCVCTHKYTHTHILLNGILETYWILLNSVTPVIKKK